MNSTWKIRVLIAIAVGVIVFGDFLGESNSSHDTFASTETAQQVQKRAAFKVNSETGKIYLEEESEKDPIKRWKIGYALREACLPKLLCEMAARPWVSLTDKERDLLNLIKSTTMSLSVALAPTRWHFAAHMGQLLRGSDESATMGCSHLWPTCPFTSKKLLALSTKFSLR